MPDLTAPLIYANGTHACETLLSCWATSARVEVPGGAEGLTRLQQNNLRALLDWPLSIRPAFEAAVARYFRDDVFETMVDDEPSPAMPALRSDHDIWALLGDTATFFLRDVEAHEALPQFDVLVECQWDAEHGLRVRFDEGAVSCVGGR